jgi:hypothetical protein
VCLCLASKKTSEQEFFVPARTDLGVKLLNYNNRLPAVDNNSQNSINCHQQATIIYELTNNIGTNNIVAQLYF